jgi:hypothetical protein
VYLARSIKPKTVLLKRAPRRDPIREERRLLERKNPGTTAVNATWRVVRRIVAGRNPWMTD